MTDLKKLVATNIKTYRKKMGLTQAQLAELADTGDNYIGQIEACRRFPSISMMERIAKVLKKDTLEFFSVEPSTMLLTENLKTEIIAEFSEILSSQLNARGLAPKKTRKETDVFKGYMVADSGKKPKK